MIAAGLGNINRAIVVTTLNKIYRDYKIEFFPKLLENPNVPPEDKQKQHTLT
jgi:hypothetical protein